MHNICPEQSRRLGRLPSSSLRVFLHFFFIILYPLFTGLGNFHIGTVFRAEYVPIGSWANTAAAGESNYIGVFDSFGYPTKESEIPTFAMARMCKLYRSLL